MATCSYQPVEGSGETDVSGREKLLSYQVVEEDEQVEPALQKLSECAKDSPLLAVDLEGENLSRKGELVLVSVATESDTFLFNIKKLGKGVFDKGLRDLLQDPDRQKLMFDCRQDSDCLWHQFRIELTNVLDLQLMQVIYRGDASTHQEYNLRGNSQILDVPRVLSLQKCLEEYVKDADLIAAKKDVQHAEGVWLATPLGRKLLRYAAADVVGMLRLYRVLWDKVKDMDAMTQLREASNKYIMFYPLKRFRSDSVFEENPFLPWRIFQANYKKEVRCMGCMGFFPSSDFSKTQKRNMEQKCPVCKKAKNMVDTRKNRENNWSRRRDYEDNYWYDTGDDDDNDCCIM